VIGEALGLVGIGRFTEAPAPSAKPTPRPGRTRAAPDRQQPAMLLPVTGGRHHAVTASGGSSIGAGGGSGRGIGIGDGGSVIGGRVGSGGGTGGVPGGGFGFGL
jgi:translation initiation factor IF-2